MHAKSPMDIALQEARAAAQRGEVPVGAVVVAPSGKIVARAGNQTRALRDPTAHAEMLVIRDACRTLEVERLVEHSLYVTLEPCAMCAAAIAHARLRCLYFGAWDQKSGGVLHGARVFSHAQCHHKPEVYDLIQASTSEQLLQDFFRDRRS